MSLNDKINELKSISTGGSSDMKVKDLIKELQKFDPEKEVVVMSNNAIKTCYIDKVLEVTESLNKTKYGLSAGDIGKILICNS